MSTPHEAFQDAPIQQPNDAPTDQAVRWVDPAQCRMWYRHNRAYESLTEDTCRDLIDAIRAQGRQEFPAVVRQTDHPTQPYEVICGARRHFSVTWLRQNGHPQFRYLIQIRDMTDEEAFRLADIENRERRDISDFERARDYNRAVDLYYGGRQKTMADRLEVSEAWLSRYLQLARLPLPIVHAFFAVTDLKEAHARALKPMLARPHDRDILLSRAAEIERSQMAAHAGRGDPLGPAEVMARLKAAVAKPKTRGAAKVYRAHARAPGLTARTSARKITLDIPADIGRRDLEQAWSLFLKDRFAGDLPNGKNR